MTDDTPQYAGWVEQLAYAQMDRALEGRGAAPIFNGRQLMEVEMQRLVNHARRHGFI
jgi:hypothetical protein